MIYLDSAATSLIKPARVEQAVLNAMRTMASPGRGGHMPAMKAAEKVYECRTAAAELFNVNKPEHIVFTHNATHGLNIAIKSLVSPGASVLTSGFEHNSVIRPLKAVGAKIEAFASILFSPDEALDKLESQIDKCSVVVCTHVSNVFGYILPIEDIAEICKEKGKPLIIDASQSAGVLDIDFEKLSPAFIAMPGHKGLFGPQGTGILICGNKVKALIEGGSGSDSISPYMPDILPDKLEAGTHNVAGIAGLAEGIKYVAEKGPDAIFAHEKKMLDRMCASLKDCDIELYKTDRPCQSGVLSVRHKKLSCEELAEKLNEEGVCVRSGLHCAPQAHETAGTLKTWTVRFSMSPFVSETQIDYVCGALKSW